jgi:hypothetical protein
VSVKILKNNNQETKISKASIYFTTGYYKQVEGPSEKEKKKTSSMNTSLDSQKNKKEVLIRNDL